MTENMKDRDTVDSARLSEKVLVVAKKAAKKEAIRRAVKIIAARLDQELEERLQGVALEAIVSTTKSAVDDAIGRMSVAGGATGSPDTRYIVAAATMDVDGKHGPWPYAVLIDAPSRDAALVRAEHLVLDDASQKVWVPEADGLPFNEAREVLRRNGLHVATPWVELLNDHEVEPPCGCGGTPVVTEPDPAHCSDAPLVATVARSAGPELQPPAPGVLGVYVPTTAPSATTSDKTQPVFVAPSVPSATVPASSWPPVYIPLPQSSEARATPELPKAPEPARTPTIPGSAGDPRSPFPPAIAEAAKLWRVPVTAAEAGAENA